ncbi:MAG: metal-dependent hydrolase [Sphingomicrobium sp.]
MDNITHTLAGALLGEMGLKRRSRFAMAACLLGANAPDIDVFAPLVLPVDGIAFHRGPVHSVFAVPILAAAITGLLWLLDRLRPHPEALPFRPGALFVVTLIAVASHPFLDWLTTYAIAIFAPVSWRWYSGNAIFIVDWVYWLLMIVGVGWSAWRWRRHLPHPGRPAQVAGILMLAYIGFNLGESSRVEGATAAELRRRGIEPVLIVAGPPPIAFWDRTIEWRSADRFGSGSFTPATGVKLDPTAQPLGLDDPQLALAERTRRYVRSFLTWSRMPIVVTIDGRAYLTDQRFYESGRRPSSGFFLIPLDKQ